MGKELLLVLADLKSTKASGFKASTVAKVNCIQLRETSFTPANSSMLGSTAGELYIFRMVTILRVGLTMDSALYATSMNLVVKMTNDHVGLPVTSSL